MPELAVGDVLRVRLYSRFDVQNAINVRYAQISFLSGTGPVTEFDVAYHIGHTVGLRIKELMGPLAVYRGCTAERIWPVQNQPVISLVDAGPGGSTGDMQPPQIAGLINLRTAKAGREGIGRMFVPFPSELINLSTGKPSSAYTDGLNDICTMLKTEQVTLAQGSNAGYRYRFGLFNYPTMHFEWIQQASPRLVWSQQRRRSFVRRPDAEPPL